MRTCVPDPDAYARLTGKQTQIILMTDRRRNTPTSALWQLRTHTHTHGVMTKTHLLVR